jgi:hypothetical protein
MRVNVLQKLDLLAKESLLLRDRQQLARQVEFLQRQLVATPSADPMRDKVNVYLGSRLAVDEILTDVYKELQQHEAERSTAERDKQSPTRDGKDQSQNKGEFSEKQ